jgi:hypothetical protein
MRPLKPSEVEDFLSRFAKFQASEIRSVDICSATTIEIRLSVQDGARSFDWIDLLLELSNVTQAKILEQNQLSCLDMDEGINIFCKDNKFVLCHGSYDSLQGVQSSSLYAICDSIKYKELPFSQ